MKVARGFVLVLLIAFVHACAPPPASQIRQGYTLTISKQDGRLQILKDEQELLGYQYETKYPPAGVDSIFRRSAFVHPLNTPSGHLLTRIHPPDHYHHYGIWNPWTHVLFEGDTLDFWNLGKKEGTVRFVRFDTLINSGQEVRFRVNKAHVAFQESGEKLALEETETIHLSQLTDSSYVIDLRVDYSCASSSPFLILAYRYGGFTWRPIKAWHGKNSEVFTSQVTSRNEVDGTRDRWCVVQGQLNDHFGGAVLMSHPENVNHPEPLRVWPATPDNEGQLMVNYSPTKFHDWLLEPGQLYTLRYRMLVFDGKMDRASAEMVWKAYARMPVK